MDACGLFCGYCSSKVCFRRSCKRIIGCRNDLIEIIIDIGTGIKYNNRFIFTGPRSRKVVGVIGTGGRRQDIVFDRW